MLKKDVKTLEDIEDYVSNPRFKIKFPKDIEKLYKIEKGCGANMIYIIDLMILRKLPTVFIKSERPHCELNRYRSIYDILLVCKYYNSNITIPEVFKFIKTILQPNKELGITSRLPYFSFCPNIRKWNFRGEITSYHSETMIRNLLSYNFKDSFPKSEVIVSNFLT